MKASFRKYTAGTPANVMAGSAVTSVGTDTVAPATTTTMATTPVMAWAWRRFLVSSSLMMMIITAAGTTSGGSRENTIATTKLRGGSSRPFQYGYEIASLADPKARSCIADTVPSAQAVQIRGILGIRCNSLI